MTICLATQLVAMVRVAIDDEDDEEGEEKHEMLVMM